MYANNNLSSIKYTYWSDDNDAQFVHIKVDGGYHDWFESENGNWGFDSHEEIYNFFLHYDLNGLLSVDQDVKREDKSFSILKNYPNPFNPFTTISYILEIDGFVKIEIYDLMGNFIRELVNENKKAGYKTVYWDSKNFKGQSVSAGVYFCLIKSEKLHKTIKMVLLK